jgi:OmpA-OmpF porin, OOP family
MIVSSTSMKRIFLLLFVGFNVGTSTAQNLVINPGFEEFIKGPPPSGFSGKPQDLKLPGWSCPNTGTPDYFRGTGNGGVPTNWAGNSNAHSGRSYTGIMSGSCGGSGAGYREYLQGQLKEPLVGGVEYKIDFHFRLSSNSEATVDRIGLLILDSPVFFNSDSPINQKPTMDFRREMDAGGWEHVEMAYTAHGGETTFIIGNFYNDAETGCVTLGYRAGRSEMLSGTAYFYIDDVSVERITNTPTVGGQRWTDNETIVLEKSYPLNNIQFAFDSDELAKTSFTLLDSLCDLLKHNDDWHIEIAGHCDDLGDEGYNQDLSLRRANSVADYLLGCSVSAQRISTLGYGSTRPVSNMKDDAARYKNRRVEVRFLMN